MKLFKFSSLSTLDLTVKVVLGLITKLPLPWNLLNNLLCFHYQASCTVYTYTLLHYGQYTVLCLQCTQLLSAETVCFYLTGQFWVFSAHHKSISILPAKQPVVCTVVTKQIIIGWDKSRIIKTLCSYLSIGQTNSCFAHKIVINL